jgi:amino acid transporter
MLGWLRGAALAVCDGMVWAELGAAMPNAGGSYTFLQQIYGPEKAGRWVSFLFVWQYMLSGPLVIASGAVGLGQYASFLWPALRHPLFPYLVSGYPLLSRITGVTALAITACLLILLLLYRNLRIIEKFARILWAGSVATLLAVIFAGFTHFHAHRAFALPPHAFQPNAAFFAGLASAMLIASYDYWGYYTICYIAGEVKDPGRTIPRSMLWSIGIIAALYISMNVSVLGVIPWQELIHNTQGDTRYAVVAVAMQRTFGQIPARIIALLVIWTAFGSLFAAMLAGSRIPYAAAVDGNFFPGLAHLHPKGRFPDRALVLLGGIACLCCFLPLSTLIESMIVIRLVMTFLLQQIGVIVLRIRRPELFRPFKMWLFPVPALFAISGSFFILTARLKADRQVWTALAIAATGTIAYAIRAWRSKDWPFRKPTIASDN